MKNDYISDIHKKDKLILHPYENLKERGTYNRKLIIKSDNIYLYDEDGKRYIDGPGGMWCNNIGHGNKNQGSALTTKNKNQQKNWTRPSFLKLRNGCSTMLPRPLFHIYSFLTTREGV